MDEFIWSSTDFPYACLIDEDRTLAFKKAIEQTVKPGDTVVDVGSGSGILSLFAAKAGAKKVYAVEIDHLLIESLRRSVKANGLEEIIEVVEKNALEADLPQNADVVIAELIETALMDEMQVQVMNQLRSKGIIGPDTKLIPGVYETFVRLLNVDNDFYGLKIMAPMHDWPFYSVEGAGWHKLAKEYLSEAQSVGRFDFQAGLVEPKVSKTIDFSLEPGAVANAIELSGLIQLSPQVSVGPTNSLNGNKILLLDSPLQGPKDVKIELNYEMSQGLGNLKLSVL